MNRISNLVCSHPQLRAVDYDETYHWVVSCAACGHLGSMTQLEWRAWQRSHRGSRPAGLTEGPASGRLARPRRAARTAKR